MSGFVGLSLLKNQKPENNISKEQYRILRGVSAGRVAGWAVSTGQINLLAPPYNPW